MLKFREYCGKINFRDRSTYNEIFRRNTLSRMTSLKILCGINFRGKFQKLRKFLPEKVSSIKVVKIFCKAILFQRYIFYVNYFSKSVLSSQIISDFLQEFDFTVSQILLFFLILFLHRSHILRWLIKRYFIHLYFKV